MPGAGWYDDGTGQTRWWDGGAWTQHVAPAPAATSSAPETPPAPASEPLRPDTATTRRSLAPEDRAPQGPSTEQTFVPESFLAEQTFVPELAYSGAQPAAAGGTSYLHHAPETPADAVIGGGSRFGGAAVPARMGFAGPEHTRIVESSGRGRGWLIALAVLTIVGIVGLTAFRIFGPDDKPAATPGVVEAAVESAAPRGELPRGFTAADDVSGYRIVKACADGGSCRTVQLAARSACQRLSANVLFASQNGNRLGSDVIAAKNVKAGKAVTLRAVIEAPGATIVRVSSVVCQPF